MRGYHSREDTDLVNMVGKIVLWKMWVTILCPSAELAFLNISVSFLVGTQINSALGQIIVTMPHYNMCDYSLGL